MDAVFRSKMLPGEAFRRRTSPSAPSGSGPTSPSTVIFEPTARTWQAAPPADQVQFFKLGIDHRNTENTAWRRKVLASTTPTCLYLLSSLVPEMCARGRRRPHGLIGLEVRHNLLHREELRASKVHSNPGTSCPNPRMRYTLQVSERFGHIEINLNTFPLGTDNLVDCIPSLLFDLAVQAGMSIALFTV